MEPRYDEGPIRDWRNLFAITGFFISRLFSLYFTFAGVKKIVRYTIPRISLYRGSFYQGYYNEVYTAFAPLKSTRSHVSDCRVNKLDIRPVALVGD